MIEGNHYQIFFGHGQSMIVKCIGWSSKRDPNNAEYTVYLIKILMTTSKDSRYSTGKVISIPGDLIYLKQIQVIKL